MRIRSGTAALCRIASLGAFMLLLCALPLSALGGEGARNPGWAAPVDLKPAQNFYKVTDDIYRSAQPTKEAMVALARFGIRSVINLRAVHNDDDKLENTDMLLRWVPINTWNIRQDDIIAVLGFMRSLPKPVLVHCQHGADRTGLVMAVYRIVEQGWSKKEALAEMRNGGYGFHSVWANIPRFIENMDEQELRRQVDKLALLP
ncbi:MAG: dual specificity protein phosphatase family protein [Desulfovibrionaceae bacterium]|nr:dual specificity protein phosphatase family protein [Desulfovibrionaceae bacterium]